MIGTRLRCSRSGRSRSVTPRRRWVPRTPPPCRRRSAPGSWRWLCRGPPGMCRPPMLSWSIQAARRDNTSAIHQSVSRGHRFGELGALLRIWSAEDAAPPRTHNAELRTSRMNRVPQSPLNEGPCRHQHSPGIPGRTRRPSPRLRCSRSGRPRPDRKSPGRWVWVRRTPRRRRSFYQVWTSRPCTCCNRWDPDRRSRRTVAAGSGSTGRT